MCKRRPFDKTNGIHKAYKKAEEKKAKKRNKILYKKNIKSENITNCYPEGDEMDELVRYFVEEFKLKLQKDETTISSDDLLSFKYKGKIK